MQKLSEVQAKLVVLASAPEHEQKTAADAAQRLGAMCMPVAKLCGYGASAAAEDAASDVASLMLLSKAPGMTAARAAVLSASTTAARVAAAVELWGFTKDDDVLSLGLNSDWTAAVFDAAEAPLSVGATVTLPQLPSPPDERVFDLWAALRDHKDTTVAFIGGGWCRRLVNAYPRLSPQLRAELSYRWAERPLHHCVVVAPPGTSMMPSAELANRWQEIFHCPLTWHFASAEAGTVYAVSGPDLTNLSPDDQDVRLVNREVHLRSKGVFHNYHGRPRSTSAVLDADAYCRTGFNARYDDASESLVPVPPMHDHEVNRLVQKHLGAGPPPRKYGMAPSWGVKKLPMAHYKVWRAKKGHYVVTKAHNNSLHEVYLGKYK
eukprot:NODE_9440_length_1424_cov_6.090208.p1 GENE.NODE_9440_length_1424_cov_6.090208~~NODE_9440_length_1424_cov_6.090208.p1  ORF type:complete len:394 (-),score=116.40 NODE_9440_length_1424_cov_6.090208:242-1372(-)